MKGSMTVEASYLFPFCFLMLGIVCILGVYIYNVSALQMTGYECILQTMEERSLEKEVLKEELLRRAVQAGEERTIGIEHLDVSVKMTASKVVINYTGTQSLLELPIKVTAAYQRVYPEMSLRLTRGLHGEKDE